MATSSHCCLPHMHACARNICLGPASLPKRSSPVHAGPTSADTIHNALSDVTARGHAHPPVIHRMLICDVTRRTFHTVTRQTGCSVHRWGVGPWHRGAEDCVSVPSKARKKAEERKHWRRHQRVIQRRQSVGSSAGPAVLPQAWHLSQ